MQKALLTGHLLHHLQGWMLRKHLKVHVTKVVPVQLDACRRLSHALCRKHVWRFANSAFITRRHVLRQALFLLQNQDIIAMQHPFQNEQPVLHGRQMVSLRQRPEPQGAPEVHHQLQPAVGAGVLLRLAQHLRLVEMVLLRGGGGHPVGGLVWPHVQVITGGSPHLSQFLGMLLPQFVHSHTQALYPLELFPGQGTDEVPAPGPEGIETFRLQPLHHLVGHIAHALGRQQKVEDPPDPACRAVWLGT